MDVIDDVEHAMSAYLENEFPVEVGEKYLRVYGALQGLFIQQDALANLIRAIHPTKDIRVTDLLKDVREARTASVGHPTEMKRNGVLSAHGIVQHSICKDGFELLSYSSTEGSSFKYVPLLKLIEKQRTEAVRILSEVVEDLRKQEAEHRVQFAGVKLMPVFSQVSYAFEKLSEENKPGRGPILATWAMAHLQETLCDFRVLLQQRGLDIDCYDSLRYVCSKIEHPLCELKKFIAGTPSEVLSHEFAAVFIDALRTYFEELREMAVEIDQEYASVPPEVIRPEPTSELLIEFNGVDARFAAMSKDMEYQQEAGRILAGC